MARNTEWFDNTFLLSFEDKLNNPNYPNQCILTDGQVRICEQYMEEHHNCDATYHKHFITYTYKTGAREYFLEFRGRYAFLHRAYVPYKGHNIQRVRWRRLDRREDLIYYGKLLAKEN